MAHVKQVNAMLGGPLDEDAIARLYERVMDEARRIQRIEAKREPEPPPATGRFDRARMSGRVTRLRAAA